jgi:fatty acid desaturase
MTHQPVPCPSALAHLRPSNGQGFAVLGLAIGPTLLACWLSVSGGWLRWACGQVLLGLALVQWFALLHECGHRTMFRSRRLNAIAGHVAGFMAMIPYRSWTRVHGRHHKWTGWQDIDPTTESLVPRQLTPFERVLINSCWRLWIPLFATLYRTENYWNVRRLSRMFPAAADRAAMGLGIAVQLAAYVALVAAVGPWLSLRAAGAGVILSLVVEDLLLLSQHTHVPQHLSGGQRAQPIPAVEQDVFTRSLRLPRWASALLLHVDAHELHHMYPFVPGYHLHRIPYEPEHQVGWWEWVRTSRRMPGVVLLFQNRNDTGFRI